MKPSCESCPLGREMLKCAVALGERAIQAQGALGVADLEATLATDLTDALPAGSGALDMAQPAWQAAIRALGDAIDQHQVVGRLGQSRAAQLVGDTDMLAGACHSGPKKGIRIPLTRTILALPFGREQCGSYHAGIMAKDLKRHRELLSDRRASEYPETQALLRAVEKRRRRRR